jgi:hypothetical protein
MRKVVPEAGQVGVALQSRAMNGLILSIGMLYVQVTCVLPGTCLHALHRKAVG